MPTPSPLEALRKRLSPITDVVYGAEHPSKTKSGGKARPPKPHYSLVRDLLPMETLHKLHGLAGRLEAEQARKRRGKR